MKKIVLAFSGGLDTSFCVPYLIETYGASVYTVTVDTGGLSQNDYEFLEAKSLELGATSHTTIDAKQKLFDNHLSYLIKGNVLRGGVYPLCVGAERVVQAQEVLAYATLIGADAVAHGSTGAGNDQVRFDSTIRILAQDVAILTPIRTLGLSRQETTAYLREKGHTVSDSKTTYSINKGLWGTTIGGKETLDSKLPLPEEAYPETLSPKETPDTPLDVKITFENGIPVALNGETYESVALIETLNTWGALHGVGRGIHVGDTILGIKGRVAFEAPAAVMLIQAHKELEKIVLSKWQQFQKSHLADFYGMLLHEGQFLDPVMRDIEAFINSSQEVVTGTITLQLYKGNSSCLGGESPFSMFNKQVATYGETNQLWDARDAEGFTKIHATQALLANRAKTQTLPTS